MGKIAACTIIAILALVGSSFAISVSVSSPVSGATVSSPVVIHASASSSYAITGWHIYVDGTAVYSGGSTQAIAPSLAMGSGTHQVIARAWDSSGAYNSVTLMLTVAAPPPNAVTVTVASPTPGATVASPVNFSASAASSYPITGWHVYVDGVDSYSGTPTNSIAPSLSMSPGPHQVVVRAWNSTGVFGSASLSLTVSAAAGPVAPANATKLSNLEANSNWFQCSSASCSGGVASTSNYWVAPFQSNPSLNGSSTGFFIAGPAYATDLFATHFGPNNVPAHFIFEFDLYVDQASYTAAQALEFDLFQVAGNRKYMFGTECNYWLQTWDVWDEIQQRWISSNASCRKFQPNAWHHVKWAVERLDSQLHYLSVTVDGVTQNISDSFAYQPVALSDWAEGAQGVQIQQDLSANPGSGFEEWVNQLTLWEW